MKDASLKLVCSLCKALRFVSISSASQVTRAAVLAARREHPQLTVHYDTEPPPDPAPPSRSFYGPVRL